MTSTPPNSTSSLWIDMTMAPKRRSDYFDEALSAGVVASVITSPHWESGFYQGVLEVVGDTRWVADNSDRALLATTVADIHRAHEENKVAIILSPQDGKIIDDKLELLHVFYGLGVRMMELTHMYRNFIGDGTIDSSLRAESGLTLFGEAVVKEMNTLGMVIDVAHTGHQTTMEAIALSEHPVIFTHANAYNVTPNFRNKRDDAIKALAANGGVMGVTPIASFCETEEGVWPTMEDFFTHVDYVAELVGVDHVGVSLDIDELGFSEIASEGLTYKGKDPWGEHVKSYEGIVGKPYIDSTTYPLAKGMESLACFPDMERGLLSRGYSQEDTNKVLGGNMLRVLEAVWGP